VDADVDPELKIQGIIMRFEEYLDENFMAFKFTRLVRTTKQKINHNKGTMLKRYNKYKDRCTSMPTRTEIRYDSKQIYCNYF
jgi:hypothetical protein